MGRDVTDDITFEPPEPQPAPTAPGDGGDGPATRRARRDSPPTVVVVMFVAIVALVAVGAGIARWRSGRGDSRPAGPRAWVLAGLPGYRADRAEELRAGRNWTPSTSYEVWADEGYDRLVMASSEALVGSAALTGGRAVTVHGTPGRLRTTWPDATVVPPPAANTGSVSVTWHEQGSELTVAMRGSAATGDAVLQLAESSGVTGSPAALHLAPPRGLHRVYVGHPSGNDAHWSVGYTRPALTLTASRAAGIRTAPADPALERVRAALGPNVRSHGRTLLLDRAEEPTEASWIDGDHIVTVDAPAGDAIAVAAAARPLDIETWRRTLAPVLDSLVLDGEREVTPSHLTPIGSGTFEGHRYDVSIEQRDGLWCWGFDYAVQSRRSCGFDTVLRGLGPFLGGSARAAAGPEEVQLVLTDATVDQVRFLAGTTSLATARRLPLTTESTRAFVATVPPSDGALVLEARGRNGAVLGWQHLGETASDSVGVTPEDPPSGARAVLSGSVEGERYRLVALPGGVPFPDHFGPICAILGFGGRERAIGCPLRSTAGDPLRSARITGIGRRFLVLAVGPTVHRVTTRGLTPPTSSAVVDGWAVVAVPHDGVLRGLDLHGEGGRILTSLDLTAPGDLAAGATWTDARIQRSNPYG